MRHMDRLVREVQAHGTLFVRLYSRNVKPKFHSLFKHVADDAILLGECLSCFVCERKHRLTKRCALNVFRHLEVTVTRDLVNRHCQTVLDERSSLFLPSYMVDPQRRTMADIPLLFARQVVTACGTLKIRDILYLRDGRLGKATHFWAEDGKDDIAVQIDVYRRSSKYVWATSDPTVSFVSIGEIIDAVASAFLDDARCDIRVILPIVAEL